MPKPAIVPQHSTIIEFPIKISSVKVAKASELSQHDPDTLNIEFDLVYAGTNTNGDMFTEAELKAAYETLVLKPIDWEHDEPNIGVITKAKYLPAEGDTAAHVTCEGTLWAWRYPEYVDLVVESAKLGQIGMGETAAFGMSMEAYFQDANYIIGDFEQVIPMSQDSGELALLRGRKLGDKLVARQLIDIVFGGCGVTENPAERQARFKAVASNKSLGSGSELFGSLDETEFALPSSRMFPIDRRDRVEASLQYFDSVIKSLGETENSEAQIQEAHARLMLAAANFGLDVSKHQCKVCSERRDDVKEESETMADENKTIEEVVETEAAGCPSPTQDEGKDVFMKRCVDSGADEDACEMSWNDKAGASDESEEVAAEAEATTEEVSEVVEETEAAEGGEAEANDVQSMFRQILDALKPNETVEVEAEASVETEAAASEEKDELTVATERISELETELARVSAAHLGFTRFSELTKSGIEVAEADVEAKKEFLAGLSDDNWKVYLTDVSAASKNSVASTEETTDETETHTATAALRLENLDKVDKYTSFWKSSEIL